jgi:excisionase family DNA binding protein
MVHLWDKIQASEVLNVSVRTLDRMRKNGSLASVKVGSRVLFLPQDVEAFISAQRRGGSHE